MAFQRLQVGRAISETFGDRFLVTWLLKASESYSFEAAQSKQRGHLAIASDQVGCSSLKPDLKCEVCEGLEQYVASKLRQSGAAVQTCCCNPDMFPLFMTLLVADLP